MKLRSFFNGERVMHNDRLCSASIRSVRATATTIADRDGWSFDVSGTREELAEIGAYETVHGEMMLDDQELGLRGCHVQAEVAS